MTDMNPCRKIRGRIAEVGQPLYRVCAKADLNPNLTSLMLNGRRKLNTEWIQRLHAALDALETR